MYIEYTYGVRTLYVYTISTLVMQYGTIVINKTHLNFLRLNTRYIVDTLKWNLHNTVYSYSYLQKISEIFFPRHRYIM